MNEHNPDHDKAGKGYWNDAWNAIPLPLLWDITSKRLGSHVERSLFSYLADAFREFGFVGTGKKLIEVGCARSAVLPLFAKKLGFQVSGIDYSPNGCEQTRLILQREGVIGEVYNCDVFSIPDDLVEQFDIVVSFGLIEHFADTAAIVNALSRLLKPGGLIFTNIPNLRGTIGFMQSKLDRAVYDIHVPLTAGGVQQAHENAGLKIITCDYFLSTNFGILNLNAIRPRSIEWWIKKMISSILVRVSMGVWWLEQKVGNLPTSRMFSPYINCLAVKPNV